MIIELTHRTKEKRTRNNTAEKKLAENNCNKTCQP